MITPPGGRGGGRGGGGGGSPQVTTPRESVHAQVLSNKIVAVDLPYGTPRATAIRQFTNSRVLTPMGIFVTHILVKQYSEVSTHANADQRVSPPCS